MPPDLYWPSPFGALAFGLCFLAWAALELGVNLRLSRPGSLKRDRLSRYLIIAAMALALPLAVAATRWHAFDLAAGRPGIFYAGLALMVAGLALRVGAIRQLGSAFVPEVAIQPGQGLVQHGLYRYVRHPSYTGAFVIIVGFGLALTNALSLAIMLPLPGLAFGFRIRVEEAALLERFGDEYRAYVRRTWRLIPFVF